MSKVYTHDEIVDVLDILYVKLMRLKNSWKTCFIFLLNPSMSNQFADINYGIKYSFGVDAYTTIHALFTSGKYSFQALSNADAVFLAEYSKARSKLKKKFPFLSERRNKVFCHFNEKQSEVFINDIVLNFNEIFEILTNLHGKAMKIFNLNYTEIRVMDQNKFECLEEEMEEFRKMLLNATLDNRFEKSNEIR